MKGVLLIGKEHDGAENFGIDLEKADLGLMLLVGSTGTGKGITHFHLYSQMMRGHTPTELGFVFMDMTRVDFGGWQEDYLYRPVLHSTDEAFKALEELGQESIARDEGRADKKRGIVIHIEECDMIVKDRARFEKALFNITQRAQGNNMFVVFSSSRPSENVFTRPMLSATDVKVVYHLASTQDWLYIAGQDLSRRLKKPGERAVFYHDKVTFLEPFNEAYVRAINNWEESGFSPNALPDYSVYRSAAGMEAKSWSGWLRKIIER